jgi:hypothetical protein
MDYDHTQRGPLAVIVTLFFLIVFALTVAFGGESAAVVTAMGALLMGILAVVWAFSSLRVTVDADRVTVRFTLGWPTRGFSTEDIAGFTRVRNKWWYGLGVRVVPGGAWMFNTWGLDAVELELRSGKRFRIGSNDSANLVAALEARITHHPGPG